MIHFKTNFRVIIMRTHVAVIRVVVCTVLTRKAKIITSWDRCMAAVRIAAATI